MVAKSYQNLEQLCEPFEKKDKLYVIVRMKNGKEKEVRWYDIDEYCRMYPDEDREALLRKYDPYWKPLKYVLMGKAGFVWVFEGDPTPYLEELCASKYIWFNNYFGWYIKGEEEDSIVEAAREWFIIHKLEWNEIAKDDNTLCENVQSVVQKKCNGKAAYKWQ